MHPDKRRKKEVACYRLARSPKATWGFVAWPWRDNAGSVDQGPASTGDCRLLDRPLPGAWAAREPIRFPGLFSGAGANGHFFWERLCSSQRTALRELSATSAPEGAGKQRPARGPPKGDCKTKS